MCTTIRRSTATLGLTAALALTSAITSTTIAQASPGTVVVAPSGANARRAPSPFAGVEQRLAASSRVKVTCWAPGGDKAEAREQRWYKYDSQGNASRWVPARELSKVPNTIGRCAVTPTATGRTTSKVALRTGPTTQDAAATIAPKGRQLTITCKLGSQSVRGNDRWYLTSTGHWVSARYVANIGAAPQWCTRAN